MPKLSDSAPSVYLPPYSMQTSINGARWEDNEAASESLARSGCGGGGTRGRLCHYITRQRGEEAASPTDFGKNQTFMSCIKASPGVVFSNQLNQCKQTHTHTQTTTNGQTTKTKIAKTTNSCGSSWNSVLTLAVETCKLVLVHNSHSHSHSFLPPIMRNGNATMT